MNSRDEDITLVEANSTVPQFNRCVQRPASTFAMPTAAAAVPPTYALTKVMGET
jgi:hypothetical protein